MSDDRLEARAVSPAIATRCGRGLCAITAALLGACQPTSGSTEAGNDPAQPAATSPGKTHALTIYGYNYTDRYIDQFYVDGQGGGNMDVSGPDTGGSGVCCLAWRDGTSLPQTVRVRWVSGGCIQTVTNRFNETSERVKHFFKEKDVVLDGPVPADPGYFEIHFYPDNERVEVAITKSPSGPRLALDPARAVDPYPHKCEVQK